MSPSTPRSLRSSLLVGATASAALVAALLSAPVTGAAEESASSSPGRAVQSILSGTESALVRVKFADAADRTAAVRAGAEIAAEPTDRTSGLVDLVVTPAQLRGIVADGAVVTQVIGTQSSGIREYQRSTRVAQAAARTGLTASKSGPSGSSAQSGPSGTTTAALEDTLVFLQSYWWTSGEQTFVAAQVATTATEDPDVQITVTWRTADGQTGQFPLSRFSDSGEYQYHRSSPVPVPAQPVSLTASSSLGGSATKAVTLWPASTPPPTPSNYQQDFIRAYMTPVDIRARINRLARQYPDLVDVIDLPNKSQGYRRTATAYVGDPTTAALVVESVQFGSQGTNGWQVSAVKQTGNNRPLAAQFRDRVLTIRLATGADGAAISTIDDVGAFVQARFPALFRAFPAVGSEGKTMPVSAPVRMSDGLLGSSVPKGPWTVQALRIGHHRDGSKVGVLAYSQEHAREWATPLVTLEFAERLLANDATDPATSALLEDVDVFVVPVVNPDGANYSFNDANFQRKNLDNWCTGQLRDPRNRNSFGVDLNRNHTIGSVYDGYVGGSTSCLSSGAAGPSEASEPEARNLIDLAAAHPNIRFAMNVHSYGGYFMWPPGAYKEQGRITLPRPSIEESAQFQSAARRIVGAIAEERGTVTWPGNTGPVADVLYSAGGNSADQLYYANGIYAWDFEVGNDVWNSSTNRWDAVGFQPPYAEGHAEAMEYAGGLVEMVRVARDFQAAGN